MADTDKQPASSGPVLSFNNIALGGKSGGVRLFRGRSSVLTPASAQGSAEGHSERRFLEGCGTHTARLERCGILTCPRLERVSRSLLATCCVMIGALWARSTSSSLAQRFASGLLAHWRVLICLPFRAMLVCALMVSARRTLMHCARLFRHTLMPQLTLPSPVSLAATGAMQSFRVRL